MPKAVRVVSANFLERISDPASRWHFDHLSYRSGNLSYADLIERLPHIAMVGDIACMGIYVSSPWSTFGACAPAVATTGFLTLSRHQLVFVASRKD